MLKTICTEWCGELRDAGFTFHGPFAAEGEGPTVLCAECYKRSLSGPAPTGGMHNGTSLKKPKCDICESPF